MRTAHNLVAGVIIALVICLPRPAFAQNRGLKMQSSTVAKPPVISARQTQAGSLQAPLAAVVKLQIKHANGSNETATGLFVGIKGKDAYFITALHAIREDPNSEYVVLVKNIQIHFRNSQSFPAVPETKNLEALDLGVVHTDVANLPRNLPKITRKDAEPGVRVHIIGNPGESWVVWTGSVQKDTVGDDVRLFRTNTDTSLAPGYSGGPVFDYDGSFLGMHTASKDSYGIAAKSRYIAEQLVAWEFPTDNFTTQLPPPPPTPTTSLPSAESEINKVLDKYEAAYSRMDAEAIWRIWPDAPAEQKQAIQGTFSLARSITMKLSERGIEVGPKATSATVTTLEVKDVVPKTGNAPPRFNRSKTIKLVKQNGAWVITSIM